MKAFRMFGVDAVIAENKEDAWKVWEEHIGEKREDYSSGDMVELFPNYELPIARGSSGDWSETYPVKVWIEMYGRGFLGSSEY